MTGQIAGAADASTEQGFMTGQHESSSRAIDLKQVVLADREAVRFLAACELNGTELRNCPAYIREWVTREGANKNANRGTGTSDVREDA